MTRHASTLQPGPAGSARVQSVAEGVRGLSRPVPLRTFKRFETRGRANLETFVQVLRGIGHTQYLFMLFPMPVARPKETIEERLKRIAPTQFR